VEWTLQELQGRATTVTEGNAKGSYVSFVIEEDVRTFPEYFYIRMPTFLV
jgi:hypothetical protein